MGESGEDSGLDLQCTDCRDPLRLSTLLGGQVPPQVPLHLSTIPPVPDELFAVRDPLVYFIWCLLWDSPASA